MTFDAKDHVIIDEDMQSAGVEKMRKGLAERKKNKKTANSQ